MVRFANDSDFNFVKRAWSVCFEDTERFVDWNFEFNYSPKNTVIAETDGVAAAMLQLIPYTMKLGGNELNARYVSGVATLPEYRGRGLVREMFDFSIPAMRDMGCDMSILIPAVEGMYEKFGYAKVCGRGLYAAEKLGGEKLSRYDDGLIERLDGIYTAAMSKRCAYISRTKQDWKRIFDDLLTASGGYIVLDDADKPTGYALAYFKDKGYEIGEVFGDIDISCTPVAAPPIMARIINAEKIMRLFSGYLEGRGSGEDIADLCSRLFAGVAAASEKEAYINLLL